MLISELSVLDNIFLDRPKSLENIEHYNTLLEHFALTKYSQSWPQTLSSGQQQRVGVMRALLGDAHFLLADEPTSHLDPARAFDLMQTLTTHLRSKSRGMICVTHDRSLVPLFDYTLDLSKA
jgi:ABC-type lipoprotein export system ATPase subunit